MMASNSLLLVFCIPANYLRKAVQSFGNTCMEEKIREVEIHLSKYENSF